MPTSIQAPRISDYASNQTPRIFSDYAPPDNMEELRYPYKWRDYDYPGILRARFPKPPLPYAQYVLPEEEMAYTEIEVKQREHRRIGLQLPSQPYDPRLLYGYDPIGDIEHKKKIANEMLRAYFNTEEGRGLNIEMSPNFFDGGNIRNEITDYRTNTDKYTIEKNNDYFSGLQYSDVKPNSKSFVKRMEYEPMSGRIDIDIETVNYTYSDYPFIAPPADPSAILKTRIKGNLTIIIKSRANPIRDIPENEKIAIETLREMITETEFRKYLKDAFILVRGRSGRVYQIFRDKDHTKVWEKGKLVEEVCVRIKRSLNVPPTDNVIAFRTAILCSENEFKKLGNVYNMAA